MNLGEFFNSPSGYENKTLRNKAAISDTKSTLQGNAMSILVLFFLLSLCPSAFSAALCSRAAKRDILPSSLTPNKPPCLRESYFFRASAFRVSNSSGMCEMLDSCSTGDFSLNPNKACDSYREYKPGEEVLLLRTVSAGDNDPYKDLRYGNRSFMHYEAANLSSQTTAFKSPAFAWPSSSWQSLRFQMLGTDLTTVNVDLLFDHVAGEDIQLGSWFAKSRLKASYPWSLATLKSTTFVTFSAEGFKNIDVIRRFNIEKFRHNCDTVTGCLKVAMGKTSVCTHDNYTEAAYVSTVSTTGGPNAWSTGFTKSQELRIYGVLSSSPERFFLKVL